MVQIQTMDDVHRHVPMSLDRDVVERGYRKAFWRIIPLFMLCYLVAYLDRVNVGFAKLQMSKDLGFSETIYGLGAGIFFIGYLFFEIPSNLALHRVGARLWIARIMLTWGVISASFAWIRSAELFYLMRFLLGAAEAGFFPGVILYLTYWYPARRRARIVAMFMTAVPLAGIVGGPLSGWILSSFGGQAGWAGWQWLFVIEAIPSVLLGLVVPFVLSNSVREARWLTDEEKAGLERDIAADVSPQQAATRSLAVLADPRVLGMSLIYFCFGFAQYGLTFWMPTLIRASGVKDDLHVGLISAIPFIAGAVTMNIVGRSADARNERRWHLAVPALIGAAGFVASALTATEPSLAILFLSVAAAGALTCPPLFWSLPTSFLRGGAAAAGIAAINSIASLAGFVSPYAIGFLNDATRDTRSGLYLVAGLLVCGALATLRVPARSLR